MALITAQDFILMSMRKVGQLRPGYTASPELMTELLNDWQVWFDALNAEENTNFDNPDYVYPVTGPGHFTQGNGYDVGPTAADWVGPRPISIVRANLVFTSGGQPPVYIGLTPISEQEWADLAIKQIPAINITSVFWYNPKFPNGIFNVFPPLNGNSIQLYQWGVLAAPAALNNVFSAPPGYADLVMWGLAQRNYFSMTAELTKRVIPYQVVCANAQHALEKVQLLNRQINTLTSDCPPDGTGRTGYYDSFVTYTGEPY